MAVIETQTLDLSGMSCPLPILKTKKAMKSLEIGDVIKVISTDAGSLKDFDAWARSTGQNLLESKEEAGKYVFLIKKQR